MAHAALRAYRDALNAQLATRQAGERSHYSALQALLQALCPQVTAQCEPHGEEVGIPDYKVTLGGAPVGYAECKDLGVPLDDVVDTAQLQRYLRYPSLLLTDFLEFRWYVDGELREQATLGALGSDRRVHLTAAGEEQTECLLRRFLEFRVQFPATAADLAARLARFAQELHDEALGSFTDPDPPLEPLRQAFEQTLLPDLAREQFADMYAQTLAYGLFSACFELRRERGPHRRFTREDAFSHLPPTNPFLRDLFYHIMGPRMPSRVRWVVDEIVDTLERTEIGEIAADFAHREGREDPVVHFYESFLREYDPKKRQIRGVYYTPEPVVSYIVRSIDWLLREKFDRPLGLADPEVYILDPACGTGTFLFEVIKTIHRTEVAAGREGGWNSYVRENLLKRLFGFELLMAPYTIAHMKLAIQLHDLGYDFSGDERLGIYLTNTLEEARDLAAQLPGLEELVEETKAADRVKQKEKIMVVLGNPPYSGHSANASWREVTDPVTRKTRREPTWIGTLIDDYKYVDGQPLRERNSKWLQDDYVKFLRFAQWRIEQTGHGIVGMITNHGYLDNPTFRGMRQSLMQTFDQMWVLDLHGNSKKKEIAPDGSKDENVFDIQQGVAIGVFARGKGQSANTEVRHAELWGTRQSKNDLLGASDERAGGWSSLSPRSGDYQFKPVDFPLKDEYDKGWRTREAFTLSGVGMTTARDEMVIDLDEQALLRRVAVFRDSPASDAEVCSALDISEKKGWDVHRARLSLRQEADLCSFVAPILYRPFDRRLIFYHDSLVWRTVRQVMRHMQRPNLGLVSARTNKSSCMDHFFVSDRMMETKCGESTVQSYLFPLYLYPSDDAKKTGRDEFMDSPWPPGQEGRRPNLSPAFVADLEQRLGLSFIPDGQGDLSQPAASPSASLPPLPQGEGGQGGEAPQGTFGPEDVFYYAYAVFHSPTYRERYAEFLKIDFPRLPLTSDRELFAALVGLGKRLVDLHLLRADGEVGSAPGFPITGDNVVERMRYLEAVPGEPPPQPPPGGASAAPTGASGGRVYINKTQYFEGVEPEVWNFHIGGYQVCQKWLKDRKRRALSWEDICHYQDIVLALRETREIMRRIDEAIPAWPLA